MKRLGNIKFIVILFILITYFLVKGYRDFNIDHVVSMLDGAKKTEVARNKDGSFDFKLIEAYKGKPYIEVNGNNPFFEEDDYKKKPFETYASLDSLGRCGTAFACIDTSIMPTKKRGKIGSVKPSGWQTKKYKHVDGKYLYNRCHLIGYQLSGENANERNLITGTRYFNVDGMLPFENLVADYVKETDNRVLYRVTPVFVQDNLVAHGVLMEAYSIEDEGEGVNFCVFVYNVQPDVKIDYKTGKSKLIEK